MIDVEIQYCFWDQTKKRGGIEAIVSSAMPKERLGKLEGRYDKMQLQQESSWDK